MDGTFIAFDETGIVSIAQYAERVNQEVEDIGARRLYTVLETILEDVSFGTNLGKVNIDKGLCGEEARENCGRRGLEPLRFVRLQVSPLNMGGG